MNDPIVLSGLSKAYADKPVLQNLDFRLPRGVVMGLLGQNGAGKTTLIQCALGLLKPQAGNACVFGEPAWELGPDNKQRLGYVAQQFDCFQWMSVAQLLDYTGSFYRHWNPARVAELVATWGLEPGKRVSKLSPGQKQRLSIIQALGHDPELLVLDEPVASLDPGARRRFLKQLLEMNVDQEKSVLFSTHITTDIERVASNVAVLKDGVIAYQGELDGLKEHVFRLRIAARRALPAELAISGLLNLRVEDRVAVASVMGIDATGIEKLAADLDARIEVEYLNLEDIFLELHP